MNHGCFNQIVLFVVGLSLLFGAGKFVNADETKAGKLVITKALYGDLPSGNSVDVTAKVAEMVKDGKLSVDATNDNFTDPAEGIVKKLTVEYTIDGVKGSMTVDENEKLTVSGVPAKIVIKKAMYGDLPNGNAVDVTAKVAAALKDDTLTIDATNDNFSDPAENVVKKLKVDYTINGKDESKTVDENQTFTITAVVSKLVIQKAEYGDLPDGTKIDVTAKVAEKVANDKLSIEATNTNFGDPVEGTAKKLKVTYTFNGIGKSKTVDENETLTISDTGE